MCLLAHTRCVGIGHLEQDTKAWTTQLRERHACSNLRACFRSVCVLVRVSFIILCASSGEGGDGFSDDSMTRLISGGVWKRAMPPRIAHVSHAFCVGAVQRCVVRRPLKLAAYDVNRGICLRIPHPHTRAYTHSLCESVSFCLYRKYVLRGGRFYPCYSPHLCFMNCHTQINVCDLLVSSLQNYTL